MVTVSAAVAAVVYAASRYDEMPPRVPIHFGAGGEPDGWAERSFSSVFLLPVIQLAIGPFTSLIGYWSARDGLDDSRRTPRNDRFLRILAVYLCGVAFLTTAMLTLGSVGMVQVAVGEASRLPPSFVWAAILMGLYVVGGAVYLILHASRIEPSPMASDPSKWRWGLFYVDPDNPRFLVERRWGWGFTLNLGQVKARLALLVFVLLLLGTLAMAIVAVGAWP